MNSFLMRQMKQMQINFSPSLTPISAASVSIRTVRAARFLRVSDVIAAILDTLNSKVIASSVYPKKMLALSVRIIPYVPSARMVIPLENSLWKMMEAKQRSASNAQLMMDAINVQTISVRHASQDTSFLKTTFAISVELIKMAVTSVTIFTLAKSAQIKVTLSSPTPTNAAAIPTKASSKTKSLANANAKTKPTTLDLPQSPKSAPLVPNFILDASSASSQQLTLSVPSSTKPTMDPSTSTATLAWISSFTTPKTNSVSLAVKNGAPSATGVTPMLV